jgi:transcriptional regulator with PAS, ATPase and Fis domain
MNKTIELIPPETMDALANYCWPSNIRELENVIELASSYVALAKISAYAVIKFQLFWARSA